MRVESGKKRGGRCMTDTASGQVAVNFVRYHPDVIGQANFNNPLEFIRPPDSSGRVMRITQEKNFHT